ncbi:MAG: autophagy-related protein 13-domain-containing protein [Linnemannia elongata]|nr:MAG: autophagy-related protein 13-domain-containing protein [Linnemannia elongata]
MSRRQSISSSSYYQPSSRPESPAVFTSSSSSANNNNNTSSSKQYSHQNLAPPQQQYQQQLQQPPPPARNQKADQILQNFYVKVIQIVVLARVTHPDVHAGIAPRKGSLRGVPLVKKTSKWFNLELEDLDIYKEDAKFWRAMAITESPPTMLVELFLDTSELSSNQVLVLLDETNRKNRVDLSGTGLHSVASTPLGQGRIRRNIILESWSLNLSNTPPDPVPEPPVVYKKSIIFFRSLFAYMRLLPAYQLYRQLKKQNHPLRIGFRVSRGQSPEESMFRESEIGIEVPLIEGETRPMLSEYRFGQVETPLGAFSLKVTYRSNCEFQVDESEAMLTSRFMDMDENYFTPTIVAHSQESSAPTRRPQSSTPLAQRPSSEMYSSGALQENFNAAPTLRPRRNSVQSLQQRSGEYSSSQSSVSSLGTRMSRKGSNGGPGGLFTPIENQNVAGTPPFSVAHGGHAAVAKHYVDPIMESPPFKLSSSQTDNRRQPSSSFSPFKSPSLSSSPSPSFLEAQPPSLSSRPSSVHLNRSPSSSSMSRVQSSQMQNSGLLGSVPKTGGTLSSIPSGGVNMLSTSVKSNASSSTSAPRVTPSFGQRHDSSGRRASSESLPPGRNRNSMVGNSSLFQLTQDDDDVGEFMKMLDTPEPLKMFGRAGGSGIGPSFASDDNNLTASGLKTKSTLDRFQQLKQINSNLSESMSNSQILAKEQQNQSPLTVTTNLNRRSTLGDLEPSSPTGLPFATTVSRHSQSFSSHQPGTPSPLHSEAPVYPSRSSGRGEHQSGLSHASSREPSTGSTPIKRQSWMLNHESPSGGSGIHRDLVRRSANIGNIAFRHGSLDQGKDILGMEEAMGRLKVEGAGEDIAFGSYPEDVHHQHSLYSAPLNTGRDGSSSSSSNMAPFSTFGADPRPIPSLASGGASTGRPGRLLRLGSGSSGASFTLPRLRPRAAEDNESLNELNSSDSAERGNRRRQSRHGRDEDEEDEMDDDGDDDEDADARGRRDVQGRDKDDKLGHNTSLNDDDDMLFIMSELSPGSNSSQDMGLVSAGLGASPSGGMMAGGGPGLNERVAGGILPLTGAMLNLRSQSQSPALVPGSGAASSSSSPHLRLFGRNNSINNNNGGNGNNGNTGHPLGHNNGNGSSGNSHNSSNNNSRSNSVSHSRVGSGSNTNNHNSIEHLGLLRRSGSGSGAGFADELLLMNAAGNLIGGNNINNLAGDYLPSTSMTPPLLLSSAQQSQQSGLPPVGYASGTSTTGTGGAYDTLLGGRRMSRGGSDRGAGSGASSAYNSFHSDSRGW